MLNINQNFDLKAPVFNFDRDYFNSVEELNAYDTSNVPDHFVTNVAGMLYLFTNGKWIPMIGTTLEIDDPAEPNDVSYLVNLIDRNCYINKDAESSFCMFYIGEEESYITIDSDNTISMSSNKDDLRPNILIHQAIGGINKWMQIGGTDKGFGLTAQNPETGDIKILTNKTLTLLEQNGGYSQVDVSLTDGDYKATVNAKLGFIHKTNDGFISNLDGEGLITESSVAKSFLTSYGIYLLSPKGGDIILLRVLDEGNALIIGSDEKFKISRPKDNTEGATITGVLSITAFANPSSTKVWATDGSTVDLTTKANVADLATKANTSDVLLKKSASGGYYIESNSNALGLRAFAANKYCTSSGNNSFAEGFNTQASGSCSHAEGEYTNAIGGHSHAEGYSTTANGSESHAEGGYTNAIGDYSHAEGDYTSAYGSYSHAEGVNSLSRGKSSHAEGSNTVSSGDSSHTEGYYTEANGFCAHALGAYNVVNEKAIHSVGIGNSATRKNAEYIYATTNSYGAVDDSKNGYKYLIGVGGYDGISTDNTTYKSVQEVIADLTARIEQLETLVANCVSISNVDEQTN